LQARQRIAHPRHDCLAQVVLLKIYGLRMGLDPAERFLAQCRDAVATQVHDHVGMTLQ
jgi:hypothetical protein